MKAYTIYVTEEIAKKAMDKGCPLQKVYEQYTGQPPIYYTLPNDDPNWYNCDAYYIPTAEQICGWLDEKHIQILVGFRGESWYYYTMNNSKYKSIGEDVNTRKEALLEGINKALDLI